MVTMMTTIYTGDTKYLMTTKMTIMIIMIIIIIMMIDGDRVIYVKILTIYFEIIF